MSSGMLTFAQKKSDIFLLIINKADFPLFYDETLYSLVGLTSD